MVKKIIMRILLASFTCAQCVPYWVCNPWSSCEDGFRTRECHDMNNCDDYDELPRETKRCDDPELYLPLNDGKEPVAHEETNSTEPEMQEITTEVVLANEDAKPNILVGLLIIAAFAIIGIIIGRKISN